MSNTPSHQDDPTLESLMARAKRTPAGTAPPLPRRLAQLTHVLAVAVVVSASAFLLHHRFHSLTLVAALAMIILTFWQLARFRSWLMVYDDGGTLTHRPGVTSTRTSETSAPSTGRGSQSAPACDIVVIEDDPTVAEVLRLALQREGCTVEVAAGGAEQREREQRDLPLPTRPLQWTERWDAIEPYLHRLPPVYRQALELYYGQCLPIADAANTARCSLWAFRRRLSRARQELRWLRDNDDPRSGGDNLNCL